MMGENRRWDLGIETAGVLRAVVEALDAGLGVVLCTVESVEGSAPRGPGARMMVPAEGPTAGTVGGGILEAKVVERARECLAAGRDARLEFDLDESRPDALGARCGGRATVRFESFLPAGRVVIFGGGHVGAAVGRVARAAGLPPLVVDDRRDLLEPIAADGIPTACAPPESWVDAAKLRPEDAVVVVTRGHAHDERTARDALTRPFAPAYAGMIGSRRKVAVTRANLARDGVPPDRLDALHSPIGLDIGAETPGEIAVAVVAEIVAERRRGDDANAATPPRGARTSRETST
jgi:xanthine dehydrogenase accessory factor